MRKKNRVNFHRRKDFDLEEDPPRKKIFQKVSRGVCILIGDSVSKNENGDPKRVWNVRENYSKGITLKLKLWHELRNRNRALISVKCSGRDL